MPKIVKECTLPPTSERPVDLIVTDRAVLRPVNGGLEVVERTEGVTMDALRAATDANLIDA